MEVEVDQVWRDDETGSEVVVIAASASIVTPVENVTGGVVFMGADGYVEAWSQRMFFGQFEYIRTIGE